MTASQPIAGLPSPGRQRLLIACLSACLVTGCSKPKAPAPAPAAEKPKVEADLLRTTLSPEAYQSLKIQTTPARRQPVQDRVLVTGWVMARPGYEVTLTAPVAGYVRAAPDLKGAPVPGTPVREDQTLFLVEPVLTPLDLIQLAALKRGAEADLVKARESVFVAERDQSRMEELYLQKLRSQQDMDACRARAKAAKEDVAAAEDRCKLYSRQPGTPLAPEPVKAPRAGSVLSVAVSPGQYVAAAAPLLTVADLTTPWLRVPVPEHYLPQLDRTRPVTVTLKSADSAAKDAPRFEAKPIALVPQVDPLKHTADMIYEVPAPKSQLAKDQMVTVLLPLGERHEETVVPYSAVLYDAYGGTWVYVEQTKPDATEHVFERRRVELGPAIGGDVVVRGPDRQVPVLPAGERVVTTGAAGLFSREFHKPPVPKAAPPQAVDDDD